MIRLRTAWLCLSLLVTLACAVRIACADEPQRPVKIYANGAALVSADFINLLLARGVKQTTDVAEELMGAYTVGQVQTRGRITADLVPNRHGGIVDVCLRGRAEAPQNTAYKGSVTVVSSSQTSIDARKRMLVDARGLRMLPAVATCRTSIEVQDVSAGGPIIERFARRRVDRLQSEAEQDASQRAQQRIAAELDREAQGPLEQAQAAFLQKVRQPALECDAFPQHVQVSTTDKHLYLKLLHQRSGQRPGPPAARPLDPRHDLAVYAHESLVDNLIESSLGGTTLTDESFLNVIETITGRAPRQLWVHARSERWSVTLPDKSPVAVNFDGGLVKVRLRTVRVTRGGQRFDAPLEIETAYTLRITPDGPRIARQGDVAVRFTDSSDASGTRGELQRFVRRKFDGFFPPDVYFDALTPPAGGSWGKLRRLKLVELNAADQWLVIGYQFPAATGTARAR